MILSKVSRYSRAPVTHLPFTVPSGWEKNWATAWLILTETDTWDNPRTLWNGCKFASSISYGLPPSLTGPKAPKLATALSCNFSSELFPEQSILAKALIWWVRVRNPSTETWFGARKSKISKDLIAKIVEGNASPIGMCWLTNTVRLCSRRRVYVAFLYQSPYNSRYNFRFTLSIEEEQRPSSLNWGRWEIVSQL